MGSNFFQLVTNYDLYCDSEQALVTSSANLAAPGLNCKISVWAGEVANLSYTAQKVMALIPLYSLLKGKVHRKKISPLGNIKVFPGDTVAHFSG